MKLIPGISVGAHWDHGEQTEHLFKPTGVTSLLCPLIVCVTQLLVVDLSVGKKETFIVSVSDVSTKILE